MKDPHSSRGNSSCRFPGINTSSGSLTADESNRLIRNEMIKGPDGVGSSSHACHHCIRKTSLLLQDLFSGFSGDHSLEIPDNGGKWVRSHDRTKAVVSIIDAFGPFPHGFGYRILQCCGTGGHRDHFGSQELHPVYIQCLTPGILFPHEHNTLHVHQRCRRGCGDSVLTGSCFCNQAGLPHFLCQKSLSQNIIDLMRTGVIQIFPFQIDLRSSQIPGHFFRIIKPGRPVGIFLKQFLQFPVERRIFFIELICFFKFQQSIHQCLRHILSTVDTESSVWISHLCILLHFSSASRTARTNRFIFSGSFRPSVSMPELTSTA